jgi:predicted RNA binding protein YcfA (HicA-like mRNA interferase family)
LPKLKVLSGREVCKILQKYGFQEIRKRGSHIVMQKQLEKNTVTVPVPDHKEIKRGTLMSVIRQSGIPKEEFETD